MLCFDPVFLINVAADDTYAFLLGFFKLYPQYASNKFYVSGESYAGIDTFRKLNILFLKHMMIVSFSIWRSFIDCWEVACRRAGHYVPQLAATILEGNKVEGNKKINLKGMAVSTPLSDSWSIVFYIFPKAVALKWCYFRSPSHSSYGHLKRCYIQIIRIGSKWWYFQSLWILSRGFRI